MRGLMIASVSLVLISVALAAPQEAGKDDLDSSIATIFTTSSPHGSTSNTAGQTSNDASNSASNCECVPYYLCRNDTIHTEGIGLIDKRAVGARGTGTSMGISGGTDSCSRIMDLCCTPPDVLMPEDKATPKPSDVSRLPAGQDCGKRNPDGLDSNKTGQTDNEALFGEFPSMVAILEVLEFGTDGKELNVYRCGGALIHTRAVMTAASCVEGKSPSVLKIRTGEWNVQTRDELFPYQDREVESVIVHEEYNSDSLYNDVAILILKTPVDTAENVDVICLPQPNENFDGSRCFSSGWGKDGFGEDRHYQVILKRVELPVVPHDVCQNSLRRTRLGKYFILNPTFMCAGGEPGKDTCTGDGGSPLVCPLKSDPTRYVQVGIVSWGIGCGDDKIPGVYTNVAALREWIEEKMIQNKLDTTA